MEAMRKSIHPASVTVNDKKKLALLGAGFSLRGLAHAIFNPRTLKPAPRKSIERLDPCDFALMHFRDPNSNGSRQIVHIDVPNICVHRRQHVFRKFS
jgi:hypothetical protein